MTLEILDDMKKSLLNVAEVGYVESDPIHSRDEKSYELPDGTQLKLGWLKQYVPELHFRPEVYEVFKDVVPVIEEADSAEGAVQLSFQLAEKGDAVLLSPACASFDLFKNFEDRGNQFKQAVRNL